MEIVEQANVPIFRHLQLKKRAYEKFKPYIAKCKDQPIFSRTLAFNPYAQILPPFFIPDKGQAEKNAFCLKNVGSLLKK